MSIRVVKAELRHAPSPIVPLLRVAGADERPPAPLPPSPRAARAGALRGPQLGSPLVGGLTPPSAALRDTRRVDTQTIGSLLHTIVDTYERPVTFEELVVAGLRHMVRGDGQLTVEHDGDELVIRDGNREVVRRRLPDTAALTAREEAETQGGIERGHTPGYLLQPAWGEAVGDAIGAIARARPALVPEEQLTARFFAFLPEYLDVYTGYTGDSGASRKLFGISYALHGGEPTITIVSPGSPAAAAGLQVGDRILGIAGESVRGASLARVGEVLARHPEGVVSFALERDGRELTIGVERAVFEAAAVVTGEVRRGVAVIRIREFNLDTPEAVRRELDALRAQHPDLAGVVLDVRANGGGHVAAGVDVADLFLDSGRITERRYPRAPGTDRVHDATLGDIAAGLPMVVLVNGASYSASELLALALSENGRATLVGSTTGGKGSMQNYSLFLPLRVTVGRYYGPNGTSPHEVGIRPALCTGRGADPCARSVLAPDSDIDAAVSHILALRRPPSP